MSSNETEKKYCDFCDGTGIVHEKQHELHGVMPLSPCPNCVVPKCHCGGKAPYLYLENGVVRECYCRDTRINIDRMKRIYTQSGIDRKYQWKYINDFRATSKSIETAKTAAYDIIRQFPNIRKGLYLWGNPGTGKTLLSSIILTELIIRHGIEGRFIKISRDFFRRLKGTFVEGSDSYGQSGMIEKELAEVDLLVVDDFGVQRDTPWEQETLYNLVDTRYESEKFTIFTSNVNPHTSLKELSQGRILSRLKEMCRIMELEGGDYREKL